MITNGMDTASVGTAVVAPPAPDRRALHAVAQCLGLDALAARTSRLLTDAGLDHLLIKGPATTRALYPGEPARRAYTDVDLLVRVQDFDRAQDVLREHGYRYLLDGVRDGEYPWYETAWRAPEPDDLVIDLHRGFAGVDDPAALFEVLFVDRGRLQLVGTPVPVPGPIGSLLLIVVHAASPGRGRKPLADLRRATEVFDPDQWRAAAALARRCAATASFRAGLDLLDDGARYAEQLDIDMPVALDQWLGGRQRDRVSVNLATALSRRTPLAGLRFAVSKVLPSPALLRLRDPRAAHGPVALTAAYARRVSLALRTAPAAIRDVREAAAATRPAPSGRLRVLDPVTWRVVLWAARSVRRARRDARIMPVDQVRVSPPPSCDPAGDRAVLLGARLSRATCLERALVRQGWLAARGDRRTLVIGTTAPSSGFRAHAWLEDDGDTSGAGFAQILRLPAPPTSDTPRLDRPARTAG
jgi:hypothetical protein